MSNSSPAKRKPTIKHILAAKNMVENGGNKGKAMIDAGYSPATAKNPSKLTRSEGFQTLMEEMGLSDEVFVTALKEGLNATKAIVMGTKSDESFVDVAPDFQTRHKYLETGLRLKGLASKEPSGVNINFNNFAQEQRDKYGI